LIITTPTASVVDMLDRLYAEGMSARRHGGN